MADEALIQTLMTTVDANAAMAAVLENTPMLTALLDRDLTFVWTNRAYAAACCHPPEFLIGKGHFDLYPNEENEAIFRNVIESGLPTYVESKPFRYPDQPDRGLTHWDWSVIPILGPDGRVTHVVLTLMDVTERTRSKLSTDLVSRLHRSSAALTRTQVMIEALDGVCELLESPIGFFYSVDPEETSMEMRVWSTTAEEHLYVDQAVSCHHDLDQAGVWADCIEQRKAVIHNEYDSGTPRRGMPQGHARVIRELVVPVFRGERVVAVLGIGNRPQDYNAADVAIVAHVAGAAWEIVDRIRASNELAASEDRYRRSIELFPEPVYMNRGGRFVYVNSACAQLLGARDAQELVGTPVMDRIAPARRARARERIGTLLERRGNAPLEETVFVRMDGSPVDVEVTATVFDAADGPLIEVVLRDITERKRALLALERAQEALLRNTEKLKQAQHVARLGWYSVDLATRQWESSPMLDSILGIDASFQRSLGGWLSIIHPEDRKEMASLLREAVRSGTPLEAECRIVRASDGEVRHVHALGQIDQDEGGRLMGTVQDVTERQRAQQAIHESQERYKVLVEQSPSAIFINRDNKIDLVNRACVELFQAASADDLLGRSVFDLFHPEDRKTVADRAKRIRHSGAPLPTANERIVRRDGEVRNVEMSAAPFKEGNNTLIHVVLRDTTDKRKAELEIRRHQQKLAELASELIQTGERERHRLAIELHDGIGQSLAAAKISAQSLAGEAKGDTSPEAGRLLGLIDHSIDHVRSMAAQLSPPALYELGLGPALERLVDDVRELYGLECLLETTAAPRNLTDERAAILFRAARELLSNVHRHSGVSTARLTLHDGRGTIILRVADEGCGFDTGIIRSGSSGRFGLFSLLQEVEQADGSIVVRSNMDSGTCVEISMPVACGAEPRHIAR